MYTVLCIVCSNFQWKKAKMENYHSLFEKVIRQLLFFFLEIIQVKKSIKSGLNVFLEGNAWQLIMARLDWWLHDRKAYNVTLSNNNSIRTAAWPKRQTKGYIRIAFKRWQGRAHETSKVDHVYRLLFSHQPITIFFPREESTHVSR